MSRWRKTGSRRIGRRLPHRRANDHQERRFNHPGEFNRAPAQPDIIGARAALLRELRDVAAAP
ncbi:MAG TPA: hypothetical protein VF776_06185 [Sphingomicrobium sp.]